MDKTTTLTEAKSAGHQVMVHAYQAPIDDMRFLLTRLIDLNAIARLPGYEEASEDTVTAVLEEAGRFCAEVVAPLNGVGDTQPPVWRQGEVQTSPGFAAAYRQFREAGWQGLQHPVAYGGQGLPKVLATACTEMLNAANLSFALCPLLSDGAIEALLTAGSDAQKALYLPRLISGEWTGTMNLTEPQAGSDLASIRTRAEPEGDGRYRLFGTKIFITYGEHDMAENIVHMVLARLPDAPPGVKGISLFLVPKFVLDADGTPGARNDVQCLSIEHKLGIHASPTAVLQFGDAGGAWGEMLGEPNRGLEAMFIMMNAARFGVGLQGIGIADRACQAARAYARTRVQGRPLAASSGRSGGDAGSATTAKRGIVGHPDVRRMLATMRALTEGARALASYAAALADMSVHHAALSTASTASGVHETAQALERDVYEYLVPVIKGWSTEMAVDVASLGVQVHGGMGFIEETGVAQYYRDARILSIYEGTTAIQANDLVGRKTARDQGRSAGRLIDAIDATIEALSVAARREADTSIADGATADSALRPRQDSAESAAESVATVAPSDAEAVSLIAIATQLQLARDAFEAVVDYVVNNAAVDPIAVYAGSVPYLKLAGIVLSGWMLGRSALAVRQALAAGEVDATFAQRKLATARFFAENILPQVLALRIAIVSARSQEGMLALDDDQF